MSTIVEALPSRKVSKSPLPTGEPCVVVIFGASGDLTRRKLIPALYDLCCEGCLHAYFQVLGVGRTQMGDEEFRRNMREAAVKSKDTHHYDEQRWQEFAKRLCYMPADFAQPEFYPQLASRLEQMQRQGASPNILFYLSVPPSLSPIIIEGLGRVGLQKNEKGWSRVIIEKPFGRDLASARELNQVVARVFDEEQVYRIDHYLGKETVQNILVFRFGNSMFEPVWNRNYVDYVEITAAESLGVENRAAFYEETGTLRDMMANHLLQLLTLTAIEPPVAYDADSVREQKVQVLRSIKPMSLKEVAGRTVRGQYGPGAVNRKPVPGYRDEPGVAKDSQTETYAAVEFHIDNWRWAGVPFYLRSGKRLATTLTEIAVHFKRTPQALFAQTPKDEIEPNVINLRMQPDEGIFISFGVKRPGTTMRVASVAMNFSYQSAFGTDTPVAYQTLLLDAMRGDPTHFTRRDEVEAEWRLITPIEEAWQELPPPKFPNYAAGSEGPPQADGLIGFRQHAWHKLTQRQDASSSSSRE